MKMWTNLSRISLKYQNEVKLKFSFFSSAVVCQVELFIFSHLVRPSHEKMYRIILKKEYFKDDAFTKKRIFQERLIFRLIWPENLAQELATLPSM
jgi:hypothetical protein